MFWLDKLPTEPLLRKECGFVKLKFVDRVKMSQQDLHAIIRRSVAGGNIFSNILDAFQHESVNTIDACRRVNQQKGVLWELLCVEYLRHVGYSSVLRFEDVDTALKSRLGLRDRDMGIDIVCRKNGEFVAVQCKFRTKRSVTWTEIATFEALCARTGPWTEHIVITNCQFVKREGKSEKDVTFTHKSFQKLCRHEWLSIGGMGNGRTLSDGGVSNAEDKREQWLARLESKTRR